MTAETMHELERIRSERKKLSQERAVAVATF